MRCFKFLVYGTVSKRLRRMSAKHLSVVQLNPVPPIVKGEFMWKDLVYNNETFYNFSINNQGQVKGKKFGTIYKSYVNKNGYPVISLPMGSRGKAKIIRIHKAVAEAFIPNPDNYKLVHHKDENKLNYSLENLEWVSHKQNTKYHNDKLSLQTEYYNNRKLTKKDIEQIKILKVTMSCRELAKMFGVSKPTIYNVCNGISYVS